MSVKFPFFGGGGLWGGGSADFIFMGARIFLINGRLIFYHYPTGADAPGAQHR